MKQVYCNELIKKLQLILQNRCSLSDDDKEVIEEVISLLRVLKTETDENPLSGIETASRIVELLLKAFLLSDEISRVITHIS